jgi:hemerythrin-like domain-containing protein
LRASLPDDHPVATMLDEHQAILGMLERLARLTAASASGARPARSELEELERVAEGLIGAEPHHQREEQVLFPALQERGVHGPPEAMASEHVRLRALKHTVHDLVRRMLSGSEDLWPQARAAAESLIEMLRSHIAKEDGVLYPMALRVIREPAVWAGLRRRCDAIGYCCHTAGLRAGEERG